TESLNRDGAQCARLQHEARGGDHRGGRTAGSHGSLSQELVHSNRRPQTPQGASGALGEWLTGKFEFGEREYRQRSAGGADTEPFLHSLGPKRRKTTSARMSAIGGTSGLLVLRMSFVARDPKRSSCWLSIC